MNELMILIEEYEANQAKAVAEAIEQGIDDAVAQRAKLGEQQAKAEDEQAERQIEEYYQAEGDFMAEGFGL